MFMEFSRSVLLLLSLLSLSGQISLADLDLCPRSDLDFFASGLKLHCPVWIERSSAIEVSGDTLDIELGHDQGNAYYAVLFHASWCPFSSKTRPSFDALSSMFPTIRHLAVEESSAMPSVFSRYGIRSFPSILIANDSARVQYHGSKDLSSLVDFYKKVTGAEPVAYLEVEESGNTGNLRPLSPWDRSPREIMRSEMYLGFSLLFICLKLAMCFFPTAISRVKALFAIYVWNLNFGIFGEWSQLLERVLHGIDLKRLWNRFRFSNKTRNFQKGANNARVWASSLASVSLGESSPSSSSRDS